MIALEKGINSKGSSSVRTELKIHVPNSLKVKLVAINPENEIVTKKQNNKEKQSIIPNVIPFAELKCSNVQEIYRVSKSYVKDIEESRMSNFAFSAIGSLETDLYLLTLASCVSYLRNNSHVCIVLENMNSLELLKINKNFTKGTFVYCDTYEWGNLTIIDYKQIAKSSKMMRTSMSELIAEFDCVLWQSPSAKVKKDLNEVYLDILSKISSVSFFVNPKGQKVNAILEEKVKYENLGLRLKGILYTRGKQ